MPAERRSRKSPVLLVEDDPTTAQGLSLALQCEGYPVRWARTGEEGLELLSLERRRSLVLLDLVLPDMTGVQFGRRMLESHTRPPLILISASSTQALDDAAATLRPAATFRKPFELSELLDTVAQAARQLGP